MRTWFFNLPFYTRYFSILAIMMAGVLTLYRVVFFWIYSYRIKDMSFFLILKAFAKGLRFDISFICMVLGIPLLLSCFHYANRWKGYTWIWRTLPIVSSILLLFLLIADVIYYENGNKHLGYEAFAYIGWEIFPLIGSAFSQNPFLFGLGILVISGIAYAVVLVLRAFPYQHESKSLLYLSVQFLVLSVLLVIGIRGGVQNSPLRTGDAIVSKETALNDVSLNPGFTVISDLKMTQVDKRHFMDTKEAVALVRKEIETPGLEFVSEEYPLLRKMTGNPKEKPKNVVILVLEGWSGKFIGSMGSSPKIQGKEVTPYFNKLLKQGLFFPKFFASGGRTTNGLMSLIGGIPDRPGLTAVRTPQILNRFSGLGNIAKSVGYDTLFVTGTDMSFNNKGSIMFHWGFDSLVGKTELEQNPNYKSGPWSYLDESSLDALHLKLVSQSPDKPLVAVIHTGTTHYPYKVPEEKYRIFDKSVQDNEYLNVLYYADWAVHDFLEKAQKSPYFKNTIFAFVSDHSHHRFLNYLEDRNVPLLFYAPGLIPPEMRLDIASQLDFLPTILGFMNQEVYFSSMGRDLRKRTGGSAYFAYGNIFGWIDPQFLYYQSVTGGAGETKTIVPPYEDLGYCYSNPSLCETHNKMTRAYLNLSDELLKKNKLFPSEKELTEIKSKNY